MNVCVPHNKFYSVCPCCYFPNPLDDYTYRRLTIYFSGRDDYNIFPTCRGCGHYYDEWKYKPYNEMQGRIIFHICSKCVYFNSEYKKGNIQNQYSWCGGEPFELIPVEKYKVSTRESYLKIDPKYKEYEELDRLCSSYLPEPVYDCGSDIPCFDPWES
jgi:hypothetical protein